MGFQHKIIMKIKNIIYLIIEKFLSSITDKIVCISESEKQSAIQKKVTKLDKLELIPNGIDIEAVQRAIPKSKKELGIEDNTFVVGMIGRLSRQKAPDIFIRSAKLIHEKIPNSAYIIVGDGEEAESTIKYAQKNNLKLILTGWTDEPYSYLKIFDLAILLSRWEGFGLAIIEYMAAKKNIIATNVDAIPTLIDNGIDGLLVNPDSPKEVLDKVMYLRNHPIEAELMKKQALDKVIKNYDINRVVNQHIEMFTELLNQ